MRRIYLDHAATTPLDAEAAKAMQPYLSEKFGNASSLHGWGREAAEALEKAREEVAAELGAGADEIVFTSGGTEADNLALLGSAQALREKGKHIVTTRFEHHAVLYPCQWLEKNGFEVSYVSPEKNGIVDVEKIAEAIRKDTVLVSVMHANNEIGTIQPIEEIAELARERKIRFHTDAVQSAGKLAMDVRKLGVDLLSISAHKFYGPKGVGALYVKRGTKLKPIEFGGGHEFGLRPGTENIPGIVGMAAALKLANQCREKEGKRLLELRETLISGVLQSAKGSWLNGDQEKRLAENANFGFPFIEGESLVLMLDEKGIAASTGSACSSHDLKPSHVLTAIGLAPEKSHGSLRLTLGHGTSREDIDYVLEVLPPIVKELTAMSPMARGKVR